MKPSVAQRLIELAEQARELGRTNQADRFLLLAWAAFEGVEMPPWRCAAKHGAAQQGGTWTSPAK